MANIKSAEKRISVIEAKTVRNRKVKSIVKTAIRRFDESVAAGNFEEAKNRFIYAEKKIMQAAAKNTLHKNAAYRKVARLAKKLNTITKKAM
jgi:small subunit ribosomal protein S20